MKPLYFFVLAILLAAATDRFAAGQQQWPMANGYRERTSWAGDEHTLQPPFSHITSFVPEYDLPYATISIYKNLMCVGLEESPNRFYGIDMTSKDTLWSFDVPESGGAVDVTAAQNDSLVYVGGQGGKGLYCLDRLTGEVKWFRPIGNLYTRNPILDEDRLYVISDSLYCFNNITGDTIWTYPLQFQATPAIDEGRCYITAHGITYAFDKFTGNLIWRKYNVNDYSTTNIVDGPHLYNTSGDSVISRNKLNGDIEWVYKVADAELPWLGLGFVAVDDKVLALSVWKNGQGKGQLYVLDKLNGQYKWHHTFTDEGTFCPMIANGVIYVVSWKERKLYGFDENTGAVLFEDDSYSYEGVQPIVYNHRLYVNAHNSIIELWNDAPSVIEEMTDKQEPSCILVFPNPSSGSFTVEYTLEELSLVSVSLYTLNGERINLLTGQLTGPGAHRVTFEMNQLPPGCYICEARIARQNLPDKESIFRTRLVMAGGD